MKNEVLFLLLDTFADHEPVYLSMALSSDAAAIKTNPKYVVRTVSPTVDAVKSVGGFSILADYSFSTMPSDYAALVLIGGFGWQSPQAKLVEPIARQAVEQGKIVGAICNACAFLASVGLLNGVRHTGNALPQLRQWGGDAYKGDSGFVFEQAVSDFEHRMVTANGSAPLEFARELLLMLDNDTPANIEMYYQFYKQGLVELTKMGAFG